MILDSLAPMIQEAVQSEVNNALYAGTLQMLPADIYTGVYPDDHQDTWTGQQYSDMTDDDLGADIDHAATAKDAFGFGAPSTAAGRGVKGASMAAGAIGAHAGLFGAGVNVVEGIANPQRMGELYGRPPANFLSVYDGRKDPGKDLIDAYAKDQFPGAGDWDRPGNLIDDRFGWGGWDERGGEGEGGGFGGTGGGFGSGGMSGGYGGDGMGW